MSRTLSISKTNLVVFLASSLMMAGCADNRGFEVKRIKTPITLDKQSPEGGEQQQQQQQQVPGDNSNLSGGQDMAVLTPEKKMETQETQETLHQVLENTTISYLEGGQEVQATPEIKQELLKDLTEIAARTNSLPREQQFVRGMSINLIQPGADQKGIEVSASLQLADRSEDMVSQVILHQVKSELDPKATFSGTTVDANWVRGSTDLMGQTWVLCTGVQADLCPSVTVALKISQEDNVQVSVVKFLRDDDGKYILDRTSSGNIVSFEEARNGQLAEENKQEQEQQAEEKVESVDETETVDKVQQQQQQQQQEEAQRKNIRTFREAEQASMESLRKMQHEKNLQLFRKAEAESMENYRKMKAEQEAKAKKTDAQTFREAEVKSMESLRKMQHQKNLQLFRKAEAESMKKYEQMKAAKSPQRTFREAEQQSMKALEDYQYQKKIEKILKDHADERSQEI